MTFDLRLLVPLLVGMVLGAIFFGGLWWTVQRAVSARWVALWFFASLLLRTGIVLGGFYLACGDDWQRWLAALLGFVMARIVVTRLTRPKTDTMEGSHASQP
jgi:F1F0 ATPase subunit 2